MAGGAGRSKVDGLRRERLLFDDVLRKSDRQWREQRGEMVSLIQETTDANEQRSKVWLHSWHARWPGICCLHVIHCTLGPQLDMLFSLPRVSVCSLPGTGSSSSRDAALSDVVCWVHCRHTAIMMVVHVRGMIAMILMCTAELSI